MSILDRHEDKWTPEPNTGCLIWTGAVSGERAVVGLSRIESGGSKQKLVSVARMVCEEVYGPAPASWFQAAHDTPNGCIGFVCVSPAHIRWATASENMMDMSPEARSEKSRNAYASRLGRGK